MTDRKRFKRRVRRRVQKTGESYTAALRHFRPTRKEEVVPQQDQEQEERARIVCSFCGKTQDDVEKLIAGPGVYICNECVQLSAGILETPKEELDKKVPQQRAEGSVSKERLLSIWDSIATGVQRAEQNQRSHVGRMLEAGITWDEIGAPFALSAVEAEARFG